MDMIEHPQTTGPEAAPDAEAVSERIVGMALGALELLSVYLGDRLGYYAALRDGPASPEELAARSGTDARYAREWLEQQAVTGLLAVEGDEPPRFRLPDGAAEALTDLTSTAYTAPFARMVTAAAVQAPALVRAYRDGGGVAWAAFGADMRESEADMNRPFYEGPLVREWLPRVPGLAERLAAPGARVADLGCGGGWTSIAIARAYPDAEVHGYDIDAPSVELARRNAEAAGVADRVRFLHHDASDPSLDSAYDLVTAFECIHDMPRPVEALRTMRRLSAAGGMALVMDMKAAEAFAAPGDEVERLLYSLSVTVCLPDSRSHEPSAATGTVMRPGTFEGYALDAGFSGIEALPIDTPLWRFYRLVP